MVKAGSLRELFEGHPDRWAKSHLAITARGKGVIPSRKNEVTHEIVSWCLYGGAAKLADDHPEAHLCTTQDKLRGAIRDLFCDRSMTGSIIMFNDHPDTTFEDVMEVVRQSGT
jgi:hypothetical protein